MTAFDLAIKKHWTRLFLQCGRTVTYTRGGDSVQLSAARSVSRGEVDTGAMTLESVQPDYLFLGADLVLSGQQVEPQAGDVIDDDGQRYEVLPMGAEPAWRYADPARGVMRVHCRHTGATP